MESFDIQVHPSLCWKGRWFVNDPRPWLSQTYAITNASVYYTCSRRPSSKSCGRYLTAKEVNGYEHLSTSVTLHAMRLFPCLCSCARCMHPTFLREQVFQTLSMQRLTYITAFRMLFPATNALIK